jgi:hypothetical protein
MTFLRAVALLRARPTTLALVAAVTVAAASCGGNAASHEVPGDASAPSGDASAPSGDAGNLLGSGEGGVPLGAACRTDADCGPGGLCDPATHACGCGGTLVTAHDVPPNLLLVLDRSCSMQKPVAGVPKWTIAAQALTKLTTTYAGRIRFGLELFPDRHAANKCAVGVIPVPVGAGTETAIDQLLSASLSTTDPNYPSGPCVTPIDAAMAEAAADPDLADMTRADFALLITDGQQAGCNAAGGDAATLAAITALARQGVRTFVVGFGAAVSAKSLDAFAQAGGAPNPSGAHAYYDASDSASLDSVLAAIAQQALSCTLQLSAPPPGGDPNLVYVYFDQTPPPVPRDASHKDGWDYDPLKNTVTFYGPTCADLQSGTVQSAEVVFGCPGSTAPPPPIH